MITCKKGVNAGFEKMSGQSSKPELSVAGLSTAGHLNTQSLERQRSGTNTTAYLQEGSRGKVWQVLRRKTIKKIVRTNYWLKIQPSVFQESNTRFVTQREATQGESDLPSQKKPLSYEVEAEADSMELLESLSREDLSSEQLQELIYSIEVCIFPDSERDALLDGLWKYIQYHRKTDSKDQLGAVCSAIRKYIAILPMERMDELSEFLESGRSIHFQLELELEVAKMVYRNFEVHPPKKVNPCPELAVRLWDMTEQYTSSRVLLLEKFATIASLSILALVAMRSVYARRAWSIVQDCPYDWFKELMNDDMDNLRSNWRAKDQDAVDWLDTIRADPGAGI